MVDTPERKVACLVLVGALLAAAGSVPAAAFGATSPAAFEDPVAATGADDHAPALVSLQSAPETDNTITRIALYRNGSATWTLQVRTRLETDDSEAEYRAFQERFRENTSRYLGEFREGITGIVGNAREVTGREMRAEGFTASTSVQSIPRRWGIVTFEFRWDGFAAVDGDRLVVGDVFEGGLFIAEGDSVEVVAPAGHRIASAEPTPDEVDGRVATWRGREDFADRHPRAVVEPTGEAWLGSTPSPVLLGGGAALVVVALAAVGYRRFRDRGAGGDASDGAAPGEGSAPAGDAPAPVGDAPAPATPADDGVLMADEDYVRAALVENGGRMRQTAIKDALGWSRSKTSRVLGRMEEDGLIRKLQLGRENVIDLVEGPPERPWDGSE